MSGSIMEIINRLSVFFCDHALKMLIQSSILIAAIFVIDLLLRKRIKAVLRYCIWLLVFVKLFTPTTLSLPTGIGYWLGDFWPEKAIQEEVVKQPTSASLVEPQAEYFIEPLIQPGSRLINGGVESHPTYNAYTPVIEESVITQAAPSINVQGVIFLVWLIGEFILVALFLQRTFFVKRIIAQSKSAESKLQDILNDSCRKIGIRKKVELKVSQSLLSPAACGLLRPKIIMPVSLLKHFSSEKLRTTLLHELAHIKRKDIWVNSLQTFLQIFYFYNPLLWIANIIVRRIREQAVDETVLVYLGEKADTYSSTLVDIAEIAFARPSLGLNMIGVVESKKALSARIKHILTRPFPKTVKLGVTGLAAIVLFAFVLLPMAKAQKTSSQKTYTADELVKKIVESENKIDDVQAHFNRYEEKEESYILLDNFDWGYDKGKEYLIEYNDKNNDEPNMPRIYTFDGKVEMDRDYDANRGNYGVMIQKDNMVWYGMLNPRMLLGYSLNHAGRDSLGAFLAKAEELKVLDQKEQINGYLCTVLEAIGLPVAENQGEETWYDLRIWIDTERDFKPLKMENYKSYGEEKPYAGRKRWDILSQRIDNIELKKINNIWFPVSGERQVFSIKDYLPPEGLTRKEFQETYANSGLTEKQIMEKLTPVLEPMVAKRRINITDIKINKGIPAEKFTIKLLDGYTVYDEFLNKSYTVGEPSEKEVLFSDDEILAQIKDLTPSELIERIPTERRNKDIRKWMAIIYRLAEIGSPAIGSITAALEKADTPNMQSTLAFTLRAIGDPNTVPALIDAMERSIESSDYGLGDVDNNSKLKTFYRRYQIKPESQSLGLGRAVRETTIALERLTGHTEGHDHFNYKASIITPEVIDELNERKHQAAEKWRIWWQANKDNIKIPSVPPEPPVNPNSRPVSGGVLAASEGSMVSFAIVPNIGDTSKQPNISIEQNQKYLKDVEENSPYLGALRGDSHQWDIAMRGYSKLDGLSTSTYQNRTYVLLCARAKYVMRPVVENKLLWSLEEVGPAVDANGKPAIYIRFDEKGGELFAEFTKANIGNRMAISIDSFGIVSVPHIASALNRELIITGDFTDDQISEMVDKLQKGMVVKPVSSELIQAAEKIKKDDIPNMSPGEFITSLLVVGFAHNIEKALWFVPDLQEFDNFAYIAEGDKITIVDVYSDGQYALVITSEIKAKDESDTDENGQLVFFLKKQEGIWQIDEIDITNLRNAQWFIDHFLEKHSNAKTIKENPKTNLVTSPVWITFVPASPIRSLTDYQHSQKVESLSSENVKICEIEIRAASDNKRIARFNYDNYPISGGRWGCKLNKQQIQEIGVIKDGTYFATMYVNGIRCSNVGELTIDSNADLSGEPVLKLVPLPTGAGQVLPYLGIIATGPNPTAPELMQSAIYFPDLFVDGIERKIKVMKWAGPDRVLQAGSQGVAILDLENYTPAIELNQPHEVWAKLGKYQSATIVIPAPDTAEKNWDEITEKFYPTTLPVAMLEGTILGPEAKPEKQSEITGLIKDLSGNPVSNAQVALSTDKLGVFIKDGKLENGRFGNKSRISQTDVLGKFNLGEKPAGEFLLIAAHDKGFALVEFNNSSDTYNIQLQPWGRIEGQLAQGRIVTENQIHMFSLPNSSWFVNQRDYRYETRCDSNGRFIFEKVPPGWFEVGYLIQINNSPSASVTSRTPVLVRAGETSNVTLGGEGQPVTGKFVTPKGYNKTVSFMESVTTLQTTRLQEPRPDNYEQMTEEQKRHWYNEWRKSEQYHAYIEAYWHDKNWRCYSFFINNDGSFRIEDVIPGKYQFYVTLQKNNITDSGIERKELGGYEGTIEVPQLQELSSDEPFDLGELELKMFEKIDSDKTQPEISKQFTVELPNGVTVELLGVCEHPSEGKQWRCADGTKLEKAPYAKTSRTIVADEGNKIREIAISFSGQNLKDANYNIRQIMGRIQSNQSQGYTESHINPNDKETLDLMAITSVFSKNNKSTSILINVSAGPWETKVVSDGKREVSFQLFGGEAAYREAAEENGKSIVGVMVRSILGDDGRALWENRVIAKDKNGNILIGKETSGGIRGRSGVYRYEFTLPLQQIASFEYQTRPYYQIDFDNVALEPGEKTDVQVRIKMAGTNLQPEELVQMESQPIAANTITPSSIVLEGTIIDPEGKPASYNISVFGGGMNTNVTTRSGQDGKFEYSNLPVGEYLFWCYLPNKFEPHLLIKTVQILKDKKTILNLNLKCHYSFSGTVTYEDGSPVVGLDMMAECEDKQVIFKNSAKTDKQGRYTLSMPLKTAVRAGLRMMPDGYTTKESIYSGFIIGRDDINFTLIKTSESLSNSSNYSAFFREMAN